MHSRVTHGLFIALSLTACRPREGGRCGGNTFLCTSPGEGLLCIQGRYVRVPCRGPGGCRTTGTSATCSRTLASVGDRCTEAGAAACSVDRMNFLRCDGTAFRLVTDCEGPSHCTASLSHAQVDSTGGQSETYDIVCDESLVRAGDPCSGEDHACSADHGSEMHCVGSAWTLQRQCRGTEHCHVDGSQVYCDETAGAAGDACQDEGHWACSEDGLSVLECRSGTLALRGRCPGPRHCNITHPDPQHTTTDCDGMLPLAGASCTAPDTACSPDGHFLECRSGHYADLAACRGPNHCTDDGHETHCDQRIAALGDYCGDFPTCAEDGHATLRCADRHYVVDRACAAEEHCEHAGHGVRCVR